MDYTTRNDLVLYKDKLYIPNNENLNRVLEVADSNPWGTLKLRQVSIESKEEFGSL